MIKVAAIHGSPRKNKNSDTLLKAVLEGMGPENIQVFHIYTAFEDIKPCTACNGCMRKEGCVIQDYMQEAYGLLEEADIVITATPVYFHSVTAQLKAFIDRTQAVWASKYVLGNTMLSRKRRLGFGICTGGPPESKSFFDCTLKVLDIFQKCINAKLVGTMTVAGVDEQPTADRPELLQKAREEGRRLLELWVEK
jgi:multimeric flavodoxin WrbA